MSNRKWAMSRMLNPKSNRKGTKERNIDEACLHELQYLKLVIKETPRLHLPATLLLPSECREACKI